jgi:hypothetical protein
MRSTSASAQSGAHKVAPIRTDLYIISVLAHNRVVRIGERFWPKPINIDGMEVSEMADNFSAGSRSHAHPQTVAKIREKNCKQKFMVTSMFLDR